MDPIYVTKTFLPPKHEYQAYLDKIWQAGQVTNQGPLVKELESELKARFNAPNMHFVANGTLALQLALHGLGITKGEVITTPFSYVASTSAILWERCKPVFVDIEPDTFCIDASKIEAAITPNTKAILAVHVFGYPCDVEKIEAIAKKHNLKVIYDAAHAFDVDYKGTSLFNYGDISICSFHATKLFHTIEGGAIFVKDQSISDKIELIKRFGHNNDTHLMLGINAKGSEFHAAMGLCNLPHIPTLKAARKAVSELYDRHLNGAFKRPSLRNDVTYNYAYYPIVIESEEKLLLLREALNKENIFPRRYFYPSLNTLSYIKDAASCPVSENIALRVLCLPLYADLEPVIVKRICAILNR